MSFSHLYEVIFVQSVMEEFGSVSLYFGHIFISHVGLISPRPFEETREATPDGNDIQLQVLWKKIYSW